jgi:adenylate kinase
MNKILFIGPQASGKGTQAEMLSKKFNLPIFSTGNVLRQRVADGDEAGKKLAEIMNSGQLVSDEMVNQIISDKISSDGSEGYILDGYPRNLSQAQFLDSVDQLTHVIEVHISDKEAIRRIGGRRTCPKCQTVYHTEYKKSAREGVCDHDGEKLVVRGDEKPEAVTKRLATYHELTEPVIDYYKSKGIYHKIDGMPSIDEVSQEILKIF